MRIRLHVEPGTRRPGTAASEDSPPRAPSPPSWRVRHSSSPSHKRLSVFTSTHTLTHTHTHTHLT
ncbi:hypothetical protein EYF80_065878 [Liparis tanakae]|uniref:Uncharacterized protein n=1 Tax=Liparis tanakae TaxID=230148 RepID=A0A4Z2E5D7_9TELE|nr:hypothetical protein EYF80_065878 [Liparis tanakae]